MQKDKLAALNTRRGGTAETTRNDRLTCKTLCVLYEHLRPAEGKTRCHHAGPGLGLARDRQSSFCVHEGAHCMGQGPVLVP
jgi:hypothetical protein